MGISLEMKRFFQEGRKYFNKNSEFYVTDSYEKIGILHSVVFIIRLCI